MPLQVAFGALKILSDQHLITGTDHWRHTTDSDALASIDPQLAAVTQKQPPSKFGRAETLSLWTATHFYLALPVLSYAIAQYGRQDPATRDRTFYKTDLEKYFIAFPYILRHYREYQELTEHFGAPTEAWWNKTLQQAFEHALPDASAATLLQSLPDYLQQKAGHVLSGGGDSLTGRIVLAYLLGQGTNPEKLPFDKRARQYLAPMHGNAPSQSLYERLIVAQNELAALEPHLGDYTEEGGLRLGALLDLVAWYGRPHMVEMVLPGLTGAAEPAIRALSSLFTDIIREGGPDYTAPPLSALPSTQKFLATQSLEAIGRLSIVKDILSTDSQADQADGAVLRRLATCLYSDATRYAVWSNAEYYVPDARRKAGFGAFRQDVANIIYCAGLFAENGNNMAGTIDPDALKQLAKRLLTAKSLKNMRTIIHAHREILNNLAIDWEVRYPEHERLRLLQFVRQTFGLEHLTPISISIKELNKGFAGSRCDGYTYYVRYREAGQTLELTIPIPKPHRAAQVQYRTAGSPDEPRFTPDGLPYSAWLEVTRQKDSQPIIIPVPGRGSFDPFGRTGSPHAGEVIGFGCSVHHASLSLLLAELAALDAKPSDLKRVTAAFMHINRAMHERHDLAAFQLAQIIAAFTEGKTYSYHDYLQGHQHIVPDKTRPYLTAYRRKGNKPLSWAEPQAARLSFGYPALYPARSPITVNPRHSWYNGQSVELPKATIDWRVLACR